MVDPVERFKTLQSLDAQRKADIEAIDKENEARAALAFAPIREAFQKLADAGAKVKDRNGSASGARTLASHLDGYSTSPRSISLSLSSDQTISVSIPVPQMRSGERMKEITFVASKTITGYGGKHSPTPYTDPDQALEAVFDLLKTWIFFPEVTACQP